jgi:hypothetical protein
MAASMELVSVGAVVQASSGAAPIGSSPLMKFVLVNGRVPRAHANCALCCAKIEESYVRNPQTRLVYCDPRCFTRDEKAAMTAIVGRSRRAS